MSTGVPQYPTRKSQDPAPTSTSTASTTAAPTTAGGPAQAKGPHGVGEKIKASVKVVHGVGEAVRGTLLTPLNKTEGEEILQRGREEIQQGLATIRQKPSTAAPAAAGQGPPPAPGGSQPPTTSTSTSAGAASHTGGPAPVSAQGVQSQMHPTEAQTLPEGPQAKYTPHGESPVAPVPAETAGPAVAGGYPPQHGVAAEGAEQPAGGSTEAVPPSTARRSDRVM